MKDGHFTLHYRLDDNGTMVYGTALCGTTNCGNNCYVGVASGELNENDEKVIQFYFPDDSPITAENIEQLEWTLVFKGTLGKEENAVVAKVFPSPDQQQDNWGTVLFNEEWETLSGYPENNWGHGSCWKDAGLAGYHTLHQSSGSLLNYTLRAPNSSTDSVGCSSATNPDIPVTPNTWMQFIIFTHQQGTIRQNGKDMQSQYLKLTLSNGVSIYFYDGDLAFWPNALPNDPNNIFEPLFSGAYSVRNIYSILESHGFTITQPLVIERIAFSQYLEQLDAAPTETQIVRMWVNQIRFVETDPFFGLCD